MYRDIETWKMQKTQRETRRGYKGLKKRKFLQNQGMHLRLGLFSSPGSVAVVREMVLSSWQLAVGMQRYHV